MRLETLKRRGDFRRVAALGHKAVAPGLVLQAAAQAEGSSKDAGIRVGFTASRRVGGSVLRNRAKRRLRSAAADVLPNRGKPHTDYVLIARATTTDRPYAALVADLQSALRRVAAGVGRARPTAATQDRGPGATL